MRSEKPESLQTKEKIFKDFDPTYAPSYQIAKPIDVDELKLFPCHIRRLAPLTYLGSVKTYGTHDSELWVHVVNTAPLGTEDVFVLSWCGWCFHEASPAFTKEALGNMLTRSRKDVVR